MTAMSDRDAELNAPDEFNPFQPVDRSEFERVYLNDIVSSGSMENGQRP